MQLCFVKLLGSFITDLIKRNNSYISFSTAEDGNVQAELTHSFRGEFAIWHTKERDDKKEEIRWGKKRNGIWDEE